MDVPGLSDLPKQILSQCGIVSALLTFAVVWFAYRFAKSEADRAVERAEAAKRLDTANATIIRLLEVGNVADTNVAVALGRIETVLSALRLGAGD